MGKVRLDESEHEGAIPFRHLERPDCPLGHRIEAAETPDAPRETTSPYPDLLSAAQAWAENAWVLFEKEISAARRGLPRACCYEAVTWI